MKKHIFLISLVFISISEAFTQLKPDAEEIEQRELVVVLEPETFPEVKIMNDHLKKAVKNYWDFSDDYIFVYKQNLGNLKDTEFAILSFTKFTVKVLSIFGGYPTNTEMGISIGLSESFEPKTPLKTLNLVHTYVMGNTKEDYALIVKEKDIIYAVQSINNGLKNVYQGHGVFYNEAKHRTTSLAEKTLLIDLELLTDKFGEEEIKQMYPYKFEVLLSDEIAEKLNEKTGEYAYFGIVRGFAGTRGETQNFMILVIDSETGKTISYSMRPMRNDYEISKKHIKSILKYDEKFKK